MDYSKFLPHKVTKMTICVSNGSPLPVQDSLCALHDASSLFQLTAQQSMPGLCLGDWRLITCLFWKGTSLRAAYLARQALCRAIAC